PLAPVLVLHTLPSGPPFSQTLLAESGLHLSQGMLLISLVRESNDAIPARLASNYICHDLSRLAAGEPSLESSLEKRH
ncbi:hypothetical protein CONLIGDRAFT_692365, partial [Coniochaeta ligniaria NRRL 30616]